VQPQAEVGELVLFQLPPDHAFESQPEQDVDQPCRAKSSGVFQVQRNDDDIRGNDQNIIPANGLNLK